MNKYLDVPKRKGGLTHTPEYAAAKDGSERLLSAITREHFRAGRNNWHPHVVKSSK